LDENIAGFVNTERPKLILPGRLWDDMSAIRFNV
jgi:hypothetical protein